MVCSKLIIHVPISFRDLPSCNGIDRTYNVGIWLYYFNRKFKLAVIQSVRSQSLLCTSCKIFFPLKRCRSKGSTIVNKKFTKIIRI